MANIPEPITGLNLIGSLAANDLFVVVDTSESDVTIRTKKTTLQQILNFIAATLAGATYTKGYVTVSTSRTITLAWLIGMTVSKVEYDGKTLNKLVTTDYSQPDGSGNVTFGFDIDTDIEINFYFYPTT